jgi:hypothetical protein
VRGQDPLKTFKLSIWLWLATGAAVAQTPNWQITLTPTLSPLPIGLCGAVHLTVMDPVTKDVPRDPQGYRITMADFDLSVSGTAVAGHQIDATHFETCGCQAGAVGTTATITAKYPAQYLPAPSRLPGVSIQKAATVTLGELKGPVNPQSCLTLANNTPEAAVTRMTAGYTKGAIIAGAGPRDPHTARATPTGDVSERPDTHAGNEGSARPPPSAQPEEQVQSTRPDTHAGNEGSARPPPSAQPEEPVQSTRPDTHAGNEGGAREATAPATNPSAPVAVTTRPAPGAIVPPTSVASTLAVVPVNPTGFQAIQGDAAGEVLLQWDPVADAEYYVIFGPGLTEGGQRVDKNENSIYSAYSHKAAVPAFNVPAGMQEWAVASYYLNNVTTPGSEFSRVSANVIARPTTATGTPAAPPPAPAASSGKYLVTITGIRAYQASFDDLLSRDGMGDEIYAAAYVRRYDRVSGQLSDATTRQSASHGDVNKFGSQRLQAGTRSLTGGIQDGDMIPDGGYITTRRVAAQDVTFPLRIWEGTLTDGLEALVISPSLWEQDGSDAVYANWVAQQQTLNISLFGKQALQQQISDRAFMPLEFGMVGDQSPAIVSIIKIVYDRALGLPISNLLSRAVDRPLGVLQVGIDATALPNRVVVLTREIIESALAKPALGSIASPVVNAPSGGLNGTPAIARIGMVSPKPGVMVIQFQDKDVSGAPNFPERPAIYQMFIQVERVP